MYKANITLLSVMYELFVRGRGLRVLCMAPLLPPPQYAI